MIRPTVLWLTLIAFAGCAEGPDQTLPSKPIEFDDAASASVPAGDPLPTVRDTRRIETH
ncbi:hypothetical protein [Tautonia rosea]|uniref:hypothetical protein n=1 Tax=Tautonia rosea TaxID=2728037 RepID=UPI0014728832|nr:hypothetical protein [Tautonia rosea]